MFSSVKGTGLGLERRVYLRGTEGMRSAEVVDIAWAAFAIVLTSALLIAFVSLH